METVKVSPRIQVVIPKKVREQLALRPGELSYPVISTDSFVGLSIAGDWTVGAAILN